MKLYRKNIQKSQASLVRVTRLLVNTLKLPITNRSIGQQLLAHPEYPALSALSDVLWDWNIENLPVNLPPERLKEINYPVVAYLNENGGHFVLIESFEKGRLTYLDGSGNRASKTISTFQENWEGILLLIGEHSYGEEKNYSKNRISELKQTIGKWGISIFSCFVLIGILVNTIPLVGFGLLLTKVVGLIIGSLLLVKEFGGQHYLLNQICQVNTKTSCDAVLQSPAVVTPKIRATS